MSVLLARSADDGSAAFCSDQANYEHVAPPVGLPSLTQPG
jgi:hypothetical protein